MLKDDLTLKPASKLFKNQVISLSFDQSPISVILQKPKGTGYQFVIHKA